MCSLLDVFPPPNEGPCTIFDSCGIKKITFPTKMMESLVGPGDISQGSYPDCFFVSSCIALAAAKPYLLQQLFTTKLISSDRNAMYHIKFWYEGEWRDVSVTADVPVHTVGRREKDLLPTPLFVHSPTHKWWALLLEKAYTSLYGEGGSSSSSSSGGNPAESLHDLTGLPVEIFVPLPKLTDSIVWKRVQGALTSCEGAVVMGTKKVMDREVGLQPGHAYALLGLFDLDTKEAHALLQNPCQCLAKLGSASDKISGKEELGRNILRISMKDLVQGFNSMYCCWVNAVPKSKNNFVIDWSSGGVASLAPGGKVLDGSGGNTENRSFHFNPGFLLLPKMDCIEDEIWLILSHKDQRRNNRDSAHVDISYTPIVCTILSKRGETGDTTTARKQLLPPLHTDAICMNEYEPYEVPCFRNMRATFQRLTIFGTPGQHCSFIVQPSTYAPHFKQPLRLSVWSSSGSTLVVPLLSTSIAAKVVLLRELSCISWFQQFSITNAIKQQQQFKVSLGAAGAKRILSTTTLTVVVSQPTAKGNTGPYYFSINAMTASSNGPPPAVVGDVAPVNYADIALTTSLQKEQEVVVSIVCCGAAATTPTTMCCCAKFHFSTTSNGDDNSADDGLGLLLFQVVALEGDTMGPTAAAVPPIRARAVLRGTTGMMPRPPPTKLSKTTKSIQGAGIATRTLTSLYSGLE